MLVRDTYASANIEVLTFAYWVKSWF